VTFRRWAAGVASAPWRAVKSLREPDARNGAALLFVEGGGVSMTAYAGFVLYIVRNHPNYAFWLGIGALLIVAIVITALASLLGAKRTIDATIAGNRLIIADQVQAAVAASVAPAVAAGVAAAVAATPSPPPVDDGGSKG
jgi:hypothetical protein